MLKYVFKNVISLITKETTIFVIVIICQISSILLSLFSYGVFQNYKAETNQININNDVIENEDDWPEFGYDLGISKKNPVEYKTIHDLCEEVGNLLKDKVANLYIECNKSVMMSLDYVNGVYKPTEEYYKNTAARGEWVDGEWFTDEQIASNEKVCVASEVMKEDYVNPDKELNLKKISKAVKKGDEYYINISGDEYLVIGFLSDQCPDIVMVPWGVLPDNYPIQDTPYFYFNRQLTQREYDSLIAIYEKYFPDRMGAPAPELEIYDPEQVYYYKTNMAISLFIAIVSAINFALLFNYIFDKRKHTLAVLRLNGCTANKARRMYLTEIMIIMIPLLLVCTLVFNRFILPWIDGLFPYINQVYSLEIYGIMAGMYVAVSYVIMNIMIIIHLRETPVLILRNSN